MLYILPKFLFLLSSVAVSTSGMFALWQKQVTVLASLGKEMTIETIWSRSSMPQQTSCILCEVNRRLFSRQESYRISVSSTQVPYCHLLRCSQSTRRALILVPIPCVTGQRFMMLECHSPGFQDERCSGLIVHSSNYITKCASLRILSYISPSFLNNSGVFLGSMLCTLSCT